MIAVVKLFRSLNANINPILEGGKLNNSVGGNLCLCKGLMCIENKS